MANSTAATATNERSKPLGLGAVNQALENEKLTGVYQSDKVDMEYVVMSILKDYLLSEGDGAGGDCPQIRCIHSEVYKPKFHDRNEHMGWGAYLIVFYRTVFRAAELIDCDDPS
ncbi:hypothetical protein B0T25DRAFT_577056 [Lasiosphaeria hispida]|uniref:Uncharacterized protein n=1 Tax=Lasiosphaeria hispida TaxID=260671 RepID=A0AAJ0MHC5_9PEZI|nr:hypothetical protein B0T25DRAFT_577056 [Lasiosphaeria hispida]